MNKTLIAFAAIVTISIGAVVFAVLCYTASGVMLYDSNFDAFRSSLSQQQGDAIVRTVKSLLAMFLVLIVGTNLLWVGFSIHLLSQIPSVRALGEIAQTKNEADNSSDK